MAEIKVKSSELKSKAETLTQLNSKFRQEVQKMIQYESELATMWEGDAQQAKLQQLVTETLAGEEHILQVHGFYCYDDGVRVSVDIVPDLTVTDDHAFICRMKEKLQPLLPGREISIVIDHNYSE